MTNLKTTHQDINLSKSCQSNTPVVFFQCHSLQTPHRMSSWTSYGVHLMNLLSAQLSGHLQIQESPHYLFNNSLWPNGAIWRHRSRSGNGLLPAGTKPLITWTNFDWSSVMSSDIHIRAVSQELHQPSISKICLKIICLKFHSNFPGANELSAGLHTVPDSCFKFHSNFPVANELSAGLHTGRDSWPSLWLQM